METDSTTMSTQIVEKQNEKLDELMLEIIKLKHELHMQISDVNYKLNTQISDANYKLNMKISYSDYKLNMKINLGTMIFPLIFLFKYLMGDEQDYSSTILGSMAMSAAFNMF